MAKIENSANNYMTDVLADKDSKMNKLKKDQKERVNSLFIKLEDQRKVYAETKKAYYQSKFHTYVLKNRANAYESSGYLQDKYQQKYENSQISTKTAEKSRDAELSRLQSYTDAYCSANSVSIFSL